MPELQSTTQIDFDTPVKRPDLTGVEADADVTLRFGYRTVPIGSQCMHVPAEEIPEPFMTWLLERAKQIEIDKGETQ